MQVQSIVLQGPHVRLEPLSESHLSGLTYAIDTGKLNEIPYTFVPPLAQLPTFIANAKHATLAGDELAFAIVDHVSNTIVGSTRFRHICPIHRKVEIGNTFITTKWQQSHINTEAKFLMLQHAFEEWRCTRVEFLTDERNTQSRRAILRIGATQEGILRNHLIMPNGFIRNSVIYSILDSEWRQVKSNLVTRMNLQGSE